MGRDNSKLHCRHKKSRLPTGSLPLVTSADALRLPRRAIPLQFCETLDEDLANY